MKDPGAKSLAADDEALTATGSKGNKKKWRKGNCCNCGKAGHWAWECRSLKKEELAKDSSKADKSDKAQKSKTKPVGSANAVMTKDEAEDGCWVVNISSEVPDADEIIDETGWLREEEETAAAVITPVSGDGGKRVKLYDSGTTHHISPYKSDFSIYVTLDPPVYLNAANQQCFPAISTGTLSICTPAAPNGAVSSTLTLHDVHHVLVVGYTLVSLSALDK